MNKQESSTETLLVESTLATARIGMTTPPVDIIIPAYNNLDITFRCVAALRMFAPRGTHVILVDNGSQDPIHTLKESVESLDGTYLRLDPNRGPYGAVNAGLALARSNVIGVVCNDVVVLPGAIQNMLDGIASGAQYVGATGIIRPVFDFGDCQAHAAVGGLLNSMRAYRGFYFSCFLATRALYETAGVYDERFGLTYGDTDHEQRIQDAGIQPMRLFNAVVYHGHGVGRKRGGIDADLANDRRDYEAFVEKWRDRPDVLAKHRPQTDADKRAFLENVGWLEGER